MADKSNNFSSAFADAERWIRMMGASYTRSATLGVAANSIREISRCVDRFLTKTIGKKYEFEHSAHERSAILQPSLYRGPLDAYQILATYRALIGKCFSTAAKVSPPRLIFADGPGEFDAKLNDNDFFQSRIHQSIFDASGLDANSSVFSPLLPVVKLFASHSHPNLFVNLGGLSNETWHRALTSKLDVTAWMQTELWPNAATCNGLLLCQPPTTWKQLGGRNLLHCEDGPAAAWDDGTKLWSINGIEVDEIIVMRPQDDKPDLILQDTNVERRALRIERHGWAEFLAAIGAKCVDFRRNEVEGTTESLFSFAMPTNRFTPAPDMYTMIMSHLDGFRRMIESQKRLLVTCPTGRLFALGVPNEVMTCEQAQRWLWPVPCNVIART